MKVLITGINGFVGSYMAEHCLLKGAQVSGTIEPDTGLEQVQPILAEVQLLECDLRDANAVDTVVEATKPDWVFHLAARSYVASSWDEPADTLLTNIIGQLNVFESMRRHKPHAKIHIAASSEEYGFCDQHELPLTEASPLRPLSPYAVSKVAQDLLAYQYYQSYGTLVVRTRAFNHTGPRQRSDFAVPCFAKQIAEIEAGARKPELRVGNLDTTRDFLDVRDVTNAYWLALDCAQAGEVYNIASGTGTRIRDILEQLLSLATTRIDVVVDPFRCRPSDPPILVGDSTKFRDLTGWKPTIPLERTLRDTLQFWREFVAERSCVKRPV